MKAYKATRNNKCLNITYEVGKTYTFTGKLEMCKSGFHFCKNVDNVLKYYSYDKDFVLLEIEVLGEVIDNKDKSVTDKFKVIKIVPKKEYNNLFSKIQIDKSGNMIYENSYGLESWKEYDKSNNMIHFKDSDGFELWKEYDKSNNMIHHKGSNGYELWQEYDESNNLIHFKDSNGSEYSITVE